jgi:hypothetical protein
MEILSDLLVMGLLGKIVAGVVILFIAIGFIPGVLIGWFVGRAT